MTAHAWCRAAITLHHVERVGVTLAACLLTRVRMASRFCAGRACAAVVREATDEDWQRLADVRRAR